MDLWKDKRLRLSITRLGVEYLAAMLLMGLFAVNTGNNLLYLVFSVMLGLFLVSGWVSRHAIQDLDLKGVEEGNLFARVQGGIKVRLLDRAPGRARGVEVHLALDQGRVDPGFYPGATRGAQERMVVLQALPDHRGPCRALRLDLRTSFPFGFLEKAWSFPLALDMLVLPHPRSFTPGPGWEGELGRSRPRAGSGSPDGARPFKERDPLSRVHWKRTAQRGTPWVRTFEDEPPAGLSLRLDLKAWVPGQAFERELELLSGGVLRARLQRRDITLRIDGEGGRREYQGYTPCWRALGLAAAEGDAFLAAGSALP
ncbi:MAG: DUF58 domain-containing protein [Holophaga sp.]|nr:DUF58 domain-containing protein [Holophaga sp.]